MTTRRSRRQPTRQSGPVATPPQARLHPAYVALENLRYQMLEVSAVALAARSMTTIPSEGTRDHALTVARLVALVDMLTDMTTAVLDDVDLVLAHVPRTGQIQMPGEGIQRD